MKKLVINTWDDLIEHLRACHEFTEAAYADTPYDHDEMPGAAHAARLMGHVTDAMLLAVWIKGVALAFQAASTTKEDNG